MNKVDIKRHFVKKIFFSQNLVKCFFMNNVDVTHCSDPLPYQVNWL